MPNRKNEDAPPLPLTTEDDGLPPVDNESMEKAADRRRDLTDEPVEYQEDMVRYLGVVSDRRISSEEFAQAGVEGQDGVTWTKETGHVLPASLFSERALRVLVDSGEFQVVEAKKGASTELNSGAMESSMESSSESPKDS